MSNEITSAPAPTEAPAYEVRSSPAHDDLSHTAGSLPTLQAVYETLFTKDGWLGDYDYGFLCMPTIPCMNRKSARQPPFFGLKTKLPALLALVMGFQHALAMIAGVVTPVLIMSGPGTGNMNLDTATRSYMLSASLISSGILSLIQITRFRIFSTKYYIGTGLLSVVGTSFNFVPTFGAMTTRMYLTGQCPTGLAPDGVTPVQLPCPEAWGAFLGTCMLCSLIEILLSFLPPRIMKNLFPPVVTGVTVFLIGAKLIGTGLTQWAGGSGPCSAMPAEGFFSVCPNLGAPNAAPWASPQWIGLGFLVFMTIMFVEFFGSPFMRNAQVVIGLVVGLIVAAATGYADVSTLDSAPTVTFLWVKNFSTFPLSIYAPAIIPLLVTYILTMVEAIGDVTASCEVSRLAVEGREFESRIQGGVLADGLGGFLSAVMTNSPMSVFAQNNGIIALTRCANASAGYMCCLFLILMGIFSKFGTLFLMIPDSVLGGMTTFLFANVASSGMRILAFLKWTRRDRFIVSAAISLGLGVSLIPNALTHFVSYTGTSTVLQGLADSANIILSTGFCVGAIIAIILNQLLPEDRPEAKEEEIAEGVRQADTKMAAKIAAEMEEAASGEKADMKHL
ncbi:permease family-domain-containing protein [Gamsiella multidivaricata]|uniref:permease family-domain-containing protein n=1 Tax=Gamsiella multidivaricata TaxID=101098 RepID=UPI002220A00A|nr:permease family-domain-containing protein [Gamsiella multidivaricata]KAG0366980.1 hypothetical protein BGZ54_004601 [Gamsiella multidivaricata]KAI7828992.1 permease family-domain-containing protein [Gamsiella multidivaricata]